MIDFIRKAIGAAPRSAPLVGALLIGGLALVGGIRATNMAAALGWYGDGLCDDVVAANPGLPLPCRYDIREGDGSNMFYGSDGPSFLACADSIDNDSDELTDCLDPDCLSDSVCRGIEWCNVESAQFAGQAGDCGGDDGVNKCQDTVDNDSDGLFNCEDPDCAFGSGTQSAVCAHFDPVCGENTCNAGSIGTDDLCGGSCADPAQNGQHCSDGSDNDGDGAVDCTDADCAYLDVCQVAPENSDYVCSNGQDDDRDLAVDCDDSDCANSSGCWWGWSGWNPANWLASYETDCSDGSDNDGNGAIDCADSYCSTDYRCNVYTFTYGQTEIFNGSWDDPYRCLDWGDNDMNGLTDCDDPACSGSWICAANPNGSAGPNSGNLTDPYDNFETNCGDGFDNDYDLATDCADPDCAADPSCGGAAAF